MTRGTLDRIQFLMAYHGYVMLLISNWKQSLKRKRQKNREPENDSAKLLYTSVINPTPASHTFQPCLVAALFNRITQVLERHKVGIVDHVAAVVHE